MKKGNQVFPGVGIMKPEMNKTKKKIQPASVKTAKATCGTLSYLSECRGAKQKVVPVRPAPPDGIGKSVRT